MPAVGITDGSPTCARCDHRAIVLLCSHLAGRWVVLECHSAWLVVDTRVKMCVPEKPTVLVRHLLYFQNNTHTTVINSGHATHLATAPTVVLRWGANETL